ncbi:MAG: T9SS type A sorting domain-containing protein [Bacteroidota bacterium]|nr:T9SS type A sorting domain-containing protein [Bacteroidota bacterium]
MKPYYAVALLLFLIGGQLAAQQDNLQFIENDPAGCCFDFLLENTHTPQSPIDRIRITVLTPGVIIAGGAMGPWEVDAEEAHYLEFASGGADLESGKLIEGFTICFERLPGVGTAFNVRWETEFGGQVVSRDTVELECEPLQSFCDSIVVTPVSVPGQKSGSCCFDITVKNRRSPTLALNGFSLTSFTAGMEFVDSARGPWKVAHQSPDRVSFIAEGDSLQPGEELGGFRVCVMRADGKPGPVHFLWRTFSDQLVRCEGLEEQHCEPYEEARADEIIHRDLGDCAHLLGFRNSHIPRSAIDGFRVTMLTAGAAIDSSFGITGWRISGRTAQAVQFRKDGAPVAPGDSATGFRFLFQPPPGGSYRISWCTLSGSTTVTCDTLILRCEPPVQTRCDSLLVDADPQQCSYDLGFVNVHEPASGINDFHLRLQTPGARITALATPFEWFVADSTATEIVFRTVTATVPPQGALTGFQVAVDRPAGSSLVAFEWCTSLDDSVLCCRVDSVRCTPPGARDDSVSYSAAQDYCSYAFQVNNLHVPQSDIDAFTVTLPDAATLLRDATAPAGWRIDSLGESSVRFVADGPGLAPGEEAADFLLHLLPGWTQTRIPFIYCTESAGSTVSCDTGSVSCEPRIVSCDIMDAISNPARPCCFEFQVRNTHLPRSSINGVNVEILTPDVTFFASTVEDADGWTHTADANRIVWRTPAGGLQPEDLLEGLVVCFDNNAIGNGDFTVLWQTVANGLVLCEDTLIVKCDRTLQVELRSELLPARFALHQNYPNPFNPVTTITFDVPHPADLTLSLYDATGRLVMDLGSGHYLAGSYRIRLDATRLSSGTYYYQLRSSSFSQSRPMLLLR